MRGRVSSAVGRIASLGGCAVACLFLAHCANSSRVDSHWGVSASDRVVQPGEPAPKGGGVYKTGAPYVVAGQTYVPQEDPHYRAEGLASWYGDDFHGRYTANGEIFDINGISAAHPTLPLPCYVRVTNLSNGRSLVVRVNDRGPYVGNRIIDVSTRAAHLLGFYSRGTVPVRVEFIGRAPMEGSDDHILEATLREHEPAPAPWNVKVASASILPPLPSQPPPVRKPSFASAVLTDATPTTGSAQATSYAETSAGTDRFVLSGRGLY
jgi:rare lipoprotein A